MFSSQNPTSYIEFFCFNKKNTLFYTHFYLTLCYIEFFCTYIFKLCKICQKWLLNFYNFEKKVCLGYILKHIQLIQTHHNSSKHMKLFMNVILQFEKGFMFKTKEKLDI